MNERLFTAGEVADAQTSEARLVLAGQAVRIREDFVQLIDEWTLEHTFDADTAVTLLDQVLKGLKV